MGVETRGRVHFLGWEFEGESMYRERVHVLEYCWLEAGDVSQIWGVKRVELEDSGTSVLG